ncbi:hypothetical protein BD410DRAFT_845973 [Rickenella mellea]|uniref:Uncharacterized protein n=1 Tax=Rickenella mellea TaxID=50990 RepID=A0A4Y7PI25_9AGAM|nr:hypothetical protein BD410DRAFT_845973 [Rickenella mellea]
MSQHIVAFIATLIWILPFRGAVVAGVSSTPIRKSSSHNRSVYSLQDENPKNRERSKLPPLELAELKENKSKRGGTGIIGGMNPDGINVDGLRLTPSPSPRRAD